MQASPNGKGANLRRKAAPSILHSLAAHVQAQDSAMTLAEQAARLSQDYARRAREQRGLMAFQNACLAQHFGSLHRSLMGGARR